MKKIISVLKHIFPVAFFIFLLAAFFSYSFISSTAESAASGSISTASASLSSQVTSTRYLWVGEESTAIAVSLADGQPGLYIPTQYLDDLAVDNSRGIIWIGTKTAIIQYKQDGTENFRYPLNLASSSILAGTKSEKKGSTAASQIVGTSSTQTTDSDRVRLSLDPSDGSLWIGAGGEVIKLSFDNRELFKISGFNQVTAVSVDIADSTCWVAEPHKIAKYGSDGTALFNLSIEESIFITALAADPVTHTLWVGSEQGLGKIDAQGQELFRTSEPVGIRDMEVNSATGALWLVTSNEIYKYGKDNQKLLTVPLCTNSYQNETSAKVGITSSSTSNENTQTTTCVAEFIALAIDAVDNTVWAATKDTLLKGSDAGDLLLQVPGYILIKALDIGLPKIGITITDPQDGAVFETSPITVKGIITDPTATVDVNGTKATVAGLDFEAKDILLTSGTNTITATATNLARQKATHAIQVTYNPPDTGPTLLLCPEPYLEQSPHPPVAGCAQQVLIGHKHWDRGYVLGQVDDTVETVVVDGITLISGGYIYNQGRILQAGWIDTFFWAYMLLAGPDGTYPVTALVTNEQGKTVSATVTFIKDMVFPNVAITSPPDGTITREQTITVTGVVDDPTAVVTDGWTGAIIPVASGAFSYLYNLGSGDGPQYVDIRATDPALNQTSVFVTVIRDATPPQITITSPADGIVTNSQTINIAGTIVDQNPGTITVAVNTGAAQPLTTSGTNFSGSASLTSGVNALLFTAIDRAGNTSTLLRSATLDQEAPTATVTGIDPNTVLTGTATISVIATDTLSGIQSVTLIVDGIVKTTLTQGPYTFNLDSFGLSAGNHTITIRVLDRAGNMTEQNIPVTVQHQFGIQITSPTTGTSINKSSALIRGTINYPANQEIGVTVNGIPAEQQGTNFAAIVPLQQGQNTITATATNIYGIQEQATITINTDSIQDQLRFTVSPASGITMQKTDGTIAFDTIMNVESYITGTIASYAYDTNGDGTPDQTGGLLTQITATYQTPGLYFPTITVTDTMGNTYTETAIVNVIDRTTVDTLLKAKWDGMKGALLAGNTETALSYFVDGAKDNYRNVFTQMGSNKINAAFSIIIEIKVPALTERVAYCEAIRLENNGRFSYPVDFVKDQNGIWKILGF